MRRLLAVLLFLACGAAFAQSAETRLFEAIDEGKPLVAEGILSRSKLDVNALNKERETPLHRAVEKGMKELTAMLLRMGARPNARSTTGETPLHLAALHADPLFTDLLIAAGADVKVRNEHGESALHWAALSGNPETTRRLLAARGADANLRDQKGNLALHGAADGGHDGVVRLLLPRTSEPRSKNAEGLTPADVARDRGYGDLAKLLEGAPRGTAPAAAGPAATPAQGFNTMDVDDPNHPRFHKQ
jgi:ankyrin repeat protein